MAELLSRLPNVPTFSPDCCVAVSQPLINILAERLLQTPTLVLSIGCGTGLLEQLLLLKTDGAVNLHGVEVPSCNIKFLPPSRVSRVPNTTSLHSEAVLAEALMFVYPREILLMAAYLDECISGALQQLVWIGPRDEWPVVEKLLLAAFFMLEVTGQPALPGHECLAIAKNPRPRLTKAVSAEREER